MATMPREPQEVKPEPVQALTVPRIEPEVPATLTVAAATEPPAAYDYTGASMLTLDAREAEHLAAPFPNEALDVLPTGEVYVSQVHYRRRLNQVFGPGQWAMVPRGKWTVDRDVMMREYVLLVRGHYVAEAVGQCEYQPTNDRMTWADAAEGVKSNALTRACKDLGIASECWDRIWANRWRDEHCIHVWIEGKGKPQWRRLDAPGFFKEGRPTDEWTAAHGIARVPPRPAQTTQREPGSDDGDPFPDESQEAYARHGVEPVAPIAPPVQRAAAPAGSGSTFPPCPKCKSAKAVIKNSFKGPDYVCYDKKGGCGLKFGPAEVNA